MKTELVIRLWDVIWRLYIFIFEKLSRSYLFAHIYLKINFGMQ